MKRILLLIFKISIIFFECQSDDTTVQHYEELINDQIDAANNYTFPEDASVYNCSEDEIHDYGTFDFIIIGAGSSGSVIANRLSEEKTWKILLLEAGKFGNDLVEIPNLQSVVELSDYNWGYTSTPQKTSCLDEINQECVLPRGRGVGGTTLVNDLIHSRPNKNDFDKWAQEGNPGWSYKEISKYLKKSENFDKNFPNATVEEKFHGVGGELNVEYTIPGHPLTWAWLRANEEKGHKIIDYNGECQSGAGLAQLNIEDGKRADAGTSFIQPAKSRGNLEISTNSYITRIIIDKRRATGVEFTKNKKTYVAKVAKEVILSAGAYGSPQILMLSGVGPKKHLQEVGIQTIVDLPVGSALRDHVTYNGLFFTSNYSEVVRPLEEYIEEFLNGTGPMTSHVGAVGFYETKSSKTCYPNIEIAMSPVSGFDVLVEKQLCGAEEDVELLEPKASISSPVTLLHTKSVGTFKLKSKNPFDYPLIDVNLLSDEEHHDIDTLYEGIQIALDIINTSTFAKINATLMKQNVPACDDKVYLSEEYWYCVLPYFTTSGHNPVGSCPMGRNPKKHVVDARTKVYGIANLRVADASIFPFTLSGQPNAVCVLIGEKVSDLIKSEYSKK